MTDMHLSDAIRYVGTDDTDIDLFESQYPVPNGVSYNSYVILDEKVAVMDTVDKRRNGEWLEKLEAALAGRKPDYLVIQHLEPDHAGSIGALAERYPDMELVASAKAVQMLPKFYPACPNPTRAVKEGDTLALGRHSLTFVMAPMVHWPEVMVSYESAEKVLFSADGFGTFGAIAKDRPWIEERKTTEAVRGALATIPGNAARAAAMLAEILESRGAKVKSADLCRCDQAEAVTDAFRCGKAVFLSSTYDGGLFPPMEHFLLHLRDKTWRNRTVALVENGSWAPAAACRMRTILEGMRDIALFDEVHTIQGAVKETDRAALEKLADEGLGEDRGGSGQTRERAGRLFWESRPARFSALHRDFTRPPWTGGGVRGTMGAIWRGGDGCGAGGEEAFPAGYGRHHLPG